MKAIKRILLLLFLVAFTGLTFVSCSDEEDVSTWVCQVNDSTIITMKLYEKEKKFYTTVNDDRGYILFENNMWYEYDNNHWNIIKESFDTWIWEYLDFYVGIYGPIRIYKFKRIW